MNVHLIDGTYELFRHYFVVPSAKDANGLEMGAVRGVLSSVLSLLDSGGMYQDAWVGRIEATQPTSFKEGIAKQIEDFFLWLSAAIRSLFGA